jgi:hypothetical protein
MNLAIQCSLIMERMPLDLESFEKDPITICLAMLDGDQRRIDEKRERLIKLRDTGEIEIPERWK